MAVQFQSYSGGPHGASPIVLPKTEGSLESLGNLFGTIGNIPGQIQQMRLRQELNDLLLKVLTAPQTETKTETTTTPPVLPRSDNIIGSQSFGSILSEPITKTQTKEVPGTEYKSAIDRLKSVGPAFGFKFPSSAEDVYATAMAKALGSMPTTEARIAGQKEIETVKGENRLTAIEARKKAAMERDTILEEGRNKRSAEHNKIIQDIANNRNLNDQQKTDKILKSRDQHFRTQEDYLKNKLANDRAAANSLEEIRKATILNGLRDDLEKSRTQIDKIRQLDTPQASAEMETAVQQYNSIVDQILQIKPDLQLDKMGLENKTGVMEWLRSLGGMRESPKVPNIVPRTTPQTTTPQTTTPRTTPQNPGINTQERQKQILEELKKRGIKVQ